MPGKKLKIKPDELMKILADYQSKLVPIMQRHGGSIDKFMGDGIMAKFSGYLARDSWKSVN